MSEIISIMIGQGGIQLGNTYHELYCMDTDLELNGQKKSINMKISQESQQFFNHNIFTEESPTGKHTLRTVLIDLDQSTIDQVKSSYQNKLYNPQNMISSNSDAQQCFSQGFYSSGNLILQQSLEQIRKLIEKCNRFQGFQIYHSMGGGTGSGFTSLLTQQLKLLYPYKNILGYSIFPEIKGNQQTYMEIYNTLLTINSTQDTFDEYFAFDNSKIKEILKRKVEIDIPNYKDYNQLISYNIQPINKQLINENICFSDQSQYQTHLVPYKQLNMLSSSTAPISNIYKLNEQYQTLSTLVDSCFTDGIITNPQIDGIYLGAQLFFRGDVIRQEVQEAILTNKMNKKIQFVDWIVSGFKPKIDYQGINRFKDCKLGCINRKVNLIYNNSCMGDFIENYSEIYDSSLRKRERIKQFIEAGMEESELFQAQEYINQLLQDYRECIQSEETTQQSVVNKSKG